MSALAPNYVVKIIDLSGTTIADPLPVTNVRFTRRLSSPGDRQLGSFSIQLIPPRGVNLGYIVGYQKLDFMQRIEIYEDETFGIPVFAGYIVDLPATLTGWQISGEEWLGRLVHRRTGHYEPFNGVVTGADLIGYVLDIWDHNHFYDDFNRASIGGDWTTISGTWAIVTSGTPSRQWLGTTGLGPAWEIHHTLALSTSQDDHFRVRLEFQSGTQASSWIRTMAVFRGGTGEWLLTVSHSATETKTNFLLTQTGAANFTRDVGKYELPFEKRSSVDFWIEDSGATDQTCEIWLNARQFMISTSTVRGIGGALALTASQAAALFDNVIIFTREKFMTPNITSSSSTIADADFPLESPQDTYLQMLSFFADNINYEWRTRAQADAGQDIIDLASEVGSDISTATRFVEGVNLQGLELSPSGKSLTTWYRFSGQGNDVNMALAEAFDKTAIGLYGIIENQLNDQRISTVDLAQQKAENELIRAKDGQASMSATVFVHPGLEFDIGDTVFVEANVPDISQTAKIVSISYETAKASRQVTFDQFPRSRSGMIGKLGDDVGLVNRGKALNAGEIILRFNPGSRFIDDTDSRLNFVNGSPIVRNEWLHFVNGSPPFPAFSPWNGTLAFGGNPGVYTEISLACTALQLVHQQDANLTLCQVRIDGSFANVINQNGSFQNQVYNSVSFVGISPALHIFKFEKEATVNLNPDVLITMDGLVLGSVLWHDIFLEGRAVNSAFLSFTISNTTTPPPIQVLINGINRTVAIGGSSAGFITNQTRLDVSQFISAPGLHTIDFFFNDADPNNPQDTLIEATLAVQLFV